MNVARLRTGEWVAGLSALALFALLFADWFSVSALGGGEFEQFGGGVSDSGFGSLGIVMVVLLLALIGLGLTLAVTTVVGRPVAWPVTAAVWTSAFGILLWLPLALRILLFQPDFGVGLPDDAVDIEPAAYAGLLLAALVPAGAWISMGDERTDAPQSRYEPPPARPIPGRES